jgi:SAM-dependent methyltransferase
LRRKKTRPDSRAVIHAAGTRFDAELHTDGYRRIHSDDDQRDRLLRLTDLQPGQSLLDLGTGNGYLAFEAARRFSRSLVTGLDIAPLAISENSRMAGEAGLVNLTFRHYDGGVFPLADQSFHGIISRYALHHFPDIGRSLGEFLRVLKPGGFFLLSDPVTLDGDTDGFVDRFQSLMPDGHVHFYRRSEIGELFLEKGFRAEQEFASSIRYPRLMDRRYQALIDETSGEILRDYEIGFEDDKILITVSVMNILFRLGDHP